jgi:hypothetical protein
VTAAAVLAALVLAAGVGWLVRVWISGGTAPDAQAQVLGFVVTAVVAVIGLVGWATGRQQDVDAPATKEQLKEAGDTLARLVRQQWREEAAARALGCPEPMPVRWQLASRSMMDYPEVIANSGALAFAGSSERIGMLAEAFRALCRRRLVITGGPGTGKTTLAVQLLLDLLDLRFAAHPDNDAHPEHPVPVLFSLVDWTPDNQRLQDWLSERLRRDYPALRFFGLDAAEELVDQGHILPVLDGLDEVDAVRRARIIKALNASLAYMPGLILTSRRNEYKSALTDAGDVLTAAAVIGPFALSNAEAAGYLHKCLPPGFGDVWEPVLDRLEAGTAQNLAELTATALGLWLVRTVYLDGQRNPNELIDKATFPDYVTLRAHLLDELIPAVLQSRLPTTRSRRGVSDPPLRPARRYASDDVRRWLSTLAEELRDAGTRDWLWWHLARHTITTPRSRLAVGLAVGLAAALTVGLVLGLVFGLTVRPAVGLVVGLVVGSVVGLIFGLVFELAFGPAVGPAFELAVGLDLEPKHVNVRLRGRGAELLHTLRRELVVGPLVGLVGGLVFGLVFGLVGGLVGGPGFGPLGGPLMGLAMGLLMGLAMGLVVGLVGGLLKFLGSVTLAARAITPLASYQGDRLLAFVRAVLLGSVLGVVSGVLLGVVLGVAVGLTGGLVVGLTGGVLFGLPFSAWVGFILASLPLRDRRRLPLHLMRFLDDAHRLGLLRVIGPAYQFRHAELQDHLAPPRP